MQHGTRFQGGGKDFVGGKSLEGNGFTRAYQSPGVATWESACSHGGPGEMRQGCQKCWRARPCRRAAPRLESALPPRADPPSSNPDTVAASAPP